MKTENIEKNKTYTPRPAEKETELDKNEGEIKNEEEKILKENMNRKALREKYPEEIEIKEVNYEVCIELNTIEQVKLHVIIEEIVKDEAILKVCIVEILLQEAQIEAPKITNYFEDEISSEAHNVNLTEAEIEKRIPRDALHDKRLESLETKSPEKNRKYNESKTDKGIPQADSLLRKARIEKCQETQNISTFNENHSKLDSPGTECRIETSADGDHQADRLRNKNERLSVLITKDEIEDQKKESEINEPIRTRVNISGIDTSEVSSAKKFQVCIPEGIPTVKLNPTDLNDIRNCKIVCKNESHSYTEEDIAVAGTNDHSSSKLQREFRRCELRSREQNRNVVKALIAIGIFTALAILFSTLVVVRTEDTV